MNQALYSSNQETWETPQTLFDVLDREFHFDVDVCALPENAKCNTYYTPEEDGLVQDWKGTCWMNPPYGRPIGKWMKKAYDTAAAKQGTVVCLVPARTDTVWWHDYAMKASEIRFIKGRLNFSNSANSAPFPSCLVIFKPYPEEKLSVLGMEKPT